MNARSISAVAFSLFFIFAGSIHFVKTQFYVDKLPAFVPAKRALVFAAGVVEIILALLALMPATRRPASLAIMAFLCCIIPINIVHLIRAQDGGQRQPILWLRVGFLCCLATWAWFNSRR